MNQLPVALGGLSQLLGWRLDIEKHAGTWDRGIGASLVGGRWNSPGVATVYASLDVSTAILEVAAHKGFSTLAVIPHEVICFEVLDPDDVHIVHPSAIPKPEWLHPLNKDDNRMRYGDGLLASHTFVVIPSVVTNQTWNVIFTPTAATGRYKQVSRDAFIIDPRLATLKK